ncbi:protein of unknown function [Candidatus Methylomirabilis oxygeniifera]|uniref:Uncharacterized protein n=1 Tax=Methylomirabilis oxygeniifera TaxID=671143 RepID=D5MKT0_METO1|nr:protein of unknown function [Candidatus Methylomirabilis oxyfera]
MLSLAGSIGGLFFACQGILCIETQEMTMRVGKDGGSWVALLRTPLICWSSHPVRGYC